MDWKDRTFSLNQLDEWTSIPALSMMGWLRTLGIIPNDVVWTRGNALTKTSLHANAIKAGYLAELAYEWDKDGESTAFEFVDALRFEVNGESKNEVVSEVLGELGR